MPVEVKGLDETLKALRQFEPDLAKNLNREIRAALTPVQKKAQGFVPNEIPGLSNWTFATQGKKITAESSAFAVKEFPKFNAAIVRRGIKLFIGRTKPNRNGFITFYRISNITAAGAIMETAGRKSGKSGQPWDRKSKSHNYSHSLNPKAGEHFIESMGEHLEGTGMMRGRLIYRAWHENEGKALARTMKAVDATIMQFQRRANAQTLRKVA